MSARTYLTLAAAVVVFSAADYYAYTTLSQLRAESQSNREKIAEAFNGLRMNTLATGETQSVEIADLRRLLDQSRDDAVNEAIAVRAEAQQRAARRVSRLDRDGKATQQRTQQEIGDAQLMTLAMKLALEDLHASVSEAGAQTSSTQAGVQEAARGTEQAAAELARLGTAVEANRRGVAGLKQAGERLYYEFTVSRTAPQTVGGFALSLRKADARRGRFTLEVLANGHRYEHKDHTVNEPVFIYAGGTPMPYELVATEVDKDSISGYVAAPKSAPQVVQR